MFARSSLGKFLFRKAVFYLITFMVSLSLIWLLPRLMPGDPIGILISKISGEIGGGAGGGSGTGGGGSGGSSLYQLLYDNWVVRLGLDKPLLEQYGIFLVNTVTFSFGPSINYYPVSALEVVTRSISWSLALLVPVIIIGWIIGTRLGAAAAFKKGIYDKVFYPFFLIGSNIPYYWFALVIISVFSGIFKIFPPGGAYSTTANIGLSISFIRDYLMHYTLPFVSLLIPFIGKAALTMRAMVLYEIGSDYMDFSESLGFSSNKLLGYVYKNAILPSLTILPMYFGAVFTGQVITEVVFGYPGMGLLFFNALISQDYNVVYCIFSTVILVILIGNFLMDIIYAYVDPRIRIAYKNE